MLQQLPKAKAKANPRLPVILNKCSRKTSRKEDASGITAYDAIKTPSSKQL